MNQLPPQGPWAPLPAPPQMAPPPQMQVGLYPRPKPSGGYKALGIVQIALGAAGALWALVSIAILIASAASFAKGVYDPPTLIYSCGHGAMSVLTGALLVATGIGVVKAKKWSRMVGVAYGAISITETLVGTAVNLLVIQPGMAARMHMPAGTAGTMQIFTVVTALFGVLVALVLPTITLVALLRARAKEELDA